MRISRAARLAASGLEGSNLVAFTKTGFSPAEQSRRREYVPQDSDSIGVKAEPAAGGSGIAEEELSLPMISNQNFRVREHTILV